MSYASHLKGHYAGVRARLLGKASAPEVPQVLLPPPQPAPIFVVPADYDEAYGAPITMIGPPSWRFIASYIAARDGTTFKVLTGRSEQKRWAKSRADLLAAIYLHTQLSMPHTARLMGYDHSMVKRAMRERGFRGKLVDLAPHTDSNIGRVWPKPARVHEERAEA